MTNNRSVLMGLSVDEQEISEEILYHVLHPYVRILNKTNEIMLTKEGNLLSVEKKVLITLLAQRALARLKGSKLSRLRPKEIEHATNLNGSSIRGALRKLMEKEMIAQDQEGGYFVPSFGLQHVLETMNRKQV